MGTAVSIDVRDDVSGHPGLAPVIAWLHHVDATFSTYRESSDITRLARGDLALAEATDEVVAVLQQCEELRDGSDGVFDVFAVPAPNGTTLDPSGFVKGWSIERSAAILEGHGLANFCINAGGDIAVRGGPRPDASWRIGIRHPEDPLFLAAVVEAGGPLAVATSATYARGAHILDPRSGEATTEMASATVIGPDLGYADAYATILFVMGLAGLDWLAAHDGYGGLLIDHNGATARTPDFPFTIAPHQPGR